MVRPNNSKAKLLSTQNSLKKTLRWNFQDDAQIKFHENGRLRCLEKVLLTGTNFTNLYGNVNIDLASSLLTKIETLAKFCCECYCYCLAECKIRYQTKTESLWGRRGCFFIVTISIFIDWPHIVQLVLFEIFFILKIN